MKYIPILASLLLASACTVQPQGTQQHVEFHPPLVYSDWGIQYFTDHDGKESCTISSGYNGLEITLHQNQANELTIAARSTHKLVPGAVASVNVGAHHYQISDVLRGNAAMRLADDLASNYRAYIEWSEQDVPSHSRKRWSNILKLDGFKSQFDACARHVLS
jgi:hypothetical protein